MIDVMLWAACQSCGNCSGSRRLVIDLKITSCYSESLDLHILLSSLPNCNNIAPCTLLRENVYEESCSESFTMTIAHIVLFQVDYHGLRNVKPNCSSRVYSSRPTCRNRPFKMYILTCLQVLKVNLTRGTGLRTNVRPENTMHPSDDSETIHTKLDRW